MANRHFDEKRYPDIDLIISELCDFSMEESDQTRYRLSNIKSSERFRYKQLDSAINCITLFSRAVPILPEINEIYIIGSQVHHLPESYLTGNHDLDLILRTNPDAFSRENPMVQRFTLRELLRYFMNDPTQQLETAEGKKIALKEFCIDIYDETMVGGLKQPNKLIYSKP